MKFKWAIQTRVVGLVKILDYLVVSSNLDFDFDFFELSLLVWGWRVSFDCRKLITRLSDGFLVLLRSDPGFQALGLGSRDFKP